MSWVQSLIVAILAVVTVIYAARALVIRRAGNPAWRRWALVAALLAVALVLNVVVLLANA